MKKVTLDPVALAVAKSFAKTCGQHQKAFGTGEEKFNEIMKDFKTANIRDAVLDDIKSHYDFGLITTVI